MVRDRYEGASVYAATRFAKLRTVSIPIKSRTPECIAADGQVDYHPIGTVKA